MANRYWVGNGGNATLTTNWSASSGGTGGASVPTLNDDVFFDANSFSLTGQTVFGSSITCKSLSFAGVTNNPAFNCPTIYTYGNITYDANMTPSVTQDVRIKGSSVVDLKDKTIGRLITETGNFNVSFNSGFSALQMPGGTPFNGNTLTHTGTFNTNGYNINLASLIVVGGSISFNFGASTIKVRYYFDLKTYGTSHTFDFGTSTIYIEYGTLYSECTFVGHGLTYNNLIVEANNLFMYGSNTFNNVSFVPIRNNAISIYYFENAKTQNILGTAVFVGYSSTYKLNLRSTTAGQQHTLTKSSGVIAGKDLDIKDSQAIGGATWYAGAGSADSGNNIGWIFDDPPLNPPMNIQAVKFKGIGARLSPAFTIFDCHYFPSQSLDGLAVHILEYQQELEAEAGTDESTIVFAEPHTLNGGDFIVNVDRRWEDAERGARVVSWEGLTEDTLKVREPIDSGGVPGVTLGPQIPGDFIRLYKYVDRTGKIKPGTFRLTRRVQGKSEGSFTMFCKDDYYLYPGNYIRVIITENKESKIVFGGTINSVKMNLVTNIYGVTEKLMAVTFMNYNTIPTRRTITINYPAGTNYADIVEDMVDLYLFQEGIKKGKISQGETLKDDWVLDVVSVAEIFEECATKSTFQLFIDDWGCLHFYKEPEEIKTSSFILDTTSNSKPFRDIQLDWSIENYHNKIFIAGNSNERGEDIILGRELFPNSIEMQNLHAGTGVYGRVERDGSLKEGIFRNAEDGTTDYVVVQKDHGALENDIVYNFTTDKYFIVRSIINDDSYGVDYQSVSGATSVTAGAGTTTNIIELTSHALNVGDMIYNATRDAYRSVLQIIDANNIVVEFVSGQAPGDTIEQGGDILVYLPQMNNMLLNALEHEAVRPAIMSYKTSKFTIEPGEKQIVNIPELGISNEEFLIEEVAVFDLGLKESIWNEVKLSRRSQDSTFTTKRNKSYIDFWGGF